MQKFVMLREHRHNLNVTNLTFSNIRNYFAQPLPLNGIEICQYSPVPQCVLSTLFSSVPLFPLGFFIIIMPAIFSWDNLHILSYTNML